MNTTTSTERMGCTFDGDEDWVDTGSSPHWGMGGYDEEQDWSICDKDCGWCGYCGDGIL